MVCIALKIHGLLLVSKKTIVKEQKQLLSLALKWINVYSFSWDSCIWTQNFVCVSLKHRNLILTTSLLEQLNAIDSAFGAHWMQLILDWTHKETIKRACAHQEAEDRGHWVKRCHLLLGKVSGVCLLLCFKRRSAYHRARIPSPPGKMYPQKGRERRKKTSSRTDPHCC